MFVLFESLNFPHEDNYNNTVRYFYGSFCIRKYLICYELSNILF